MNMRTMTTVLALLAASQGFTQLPVPKPLPVVPAEGAAQLEALIGTGLTAKPIKPR